ncbi:MAG: NAD(P)/FAD-dependent oxidoreductase [Pseudomonadota bacterium]
MAGPHTYNVIVLGAGGAGLMCAAVAGQAGLRVCVVDHAEKVGKKILISGGGRCNFTNLNPLPERYLSANPHFAKSALGRYTAADFIALVEAYGIAWHEKTLGQLFCDQSAKQIVDLLLAECAKGGVEVKTGCSIADVAHRDGDFHVATSQGPMMAPRLVIATGGPSIPKMGATGYAYDLARQFGLKVVEPRPALVPLTLRADDALFRELSGVSAPTRVAHRKTQFEEATLFTHKGLSGPAILQISSYWRHGDAIAIDFLTGLPQGSLLDVKRSAPQTSLLNALTHHLPHHLPQRLAEALVHRLGLSGPLQHHADSRLQAAEAQLRAWSFSPSGTEGYAKAEVTAGGISTAELSSKTMEAKHVPGLYVIGEAVDVTGWLGGYNFQWAWSSGVVAGEAMAHSVHQASTVVKATPMQRNVQANS